MTGARTSGKNGTKCKFVRCQDNIHTVFLLISKKSTTRNTRVKSVVTAVLPSILHLRYSVHTPLHPERMHHSFDGPVCIGGVPRCCHAFTQHRNTILSNLFLLSSPLPLPPPSSSHIALYLDTGLVTDMAASVVDTGGAQHRLKGGEQRK